MAWSVGKVTAVSGRLTDAQIWNELCLGLLINRHTAECFSDDEVSAELRCVWKDQRKLLPWRIA